MSNDQAVSVSFKQHVRDYAENLMLNGL